MPSYLDWGSLEILLNRVLIVQCFKNRVSSQMSYYLNSDTTFQYKLRLLVFKYVILFFRKYQSHGMKFQYDILVIASITVGILTRSEPTEQSYIDESSAPSYIMPRNVFIVKNGRLETSSWVIYSKWSHKDVWSPTVIKKIPL